MRTPIALAPLSDSETAALVAALLGPDHSVGTLGQSIAGGPPVILSSPRRSCANWPSAVYCVAAWRVHVDCRGDEVSVPATLQATIAARIDRLDPKPSGPRVPRR